MRRLKRIFFQQREEFLSILRRRRLIERLRIILEDIRIALAKHRPLKRSGSSKPSIMLLVDVPGWAWDYKAQRIKKYLSDEFDFEILYWSDFKWRHLATYLKQSGHDIYFTFECNFVPHLEGVNFRKVITGVTSHTYVNFKDYQRSLRRAYAIHANSRLLYEEVKKINSNCHYVPNGVDEELFNYVYRDASEPFAVGYVGKRTVRKGYDNFVVPACEKAAVPLKSITAKYNHAGKIDHEQMPDFYKGIDAVIIASDMDGTPNQLLEASAVGRTFIANAIGNVPEFHNSKNGFIVARNIDAYVEKILWLKERRDECLRMGREARKTVESEWTWKIQAENYRKLFRNVLKK